jgi:hypothetical protein
VLDELWSVAGYLSEQQESLVRLIDSVTCVGEGLPPWANRLHDCASASLLFSGGSSFPQIQLQLTRAVECRGATRKIWITPQAAESGRLTRLQP